MYAIKEAVIAKDHVPGLATTIFYMDMRTHGKDFDKYLERARDESNVRFVRCRVNGVEPQGPNGDLRIHYINEKGRQVEEYYDMVVLSVGLQTPKHVLDLAETTGIQLTVRQIRRHLRFCPRSRPPRPVSSPAAPSPAPRIYPSRWSRVPPLRRRWPTCSLRRGTS